MPPTNPSEPTQLNPNTNPQPSFTPPPQPQPVAQPVQPQIPVQNNGIQQATKSSGSKSSTKIVLIIIAILAGLIIVPFIILIIYLTVSNLQIGKTSDNFMNAMSKGNVSEALVYTDGSAETKQFLEGMAPSVKATKVTKKATQKKDDVNYFLYSLEGATSNSARTELKNNNGKWQVAGFYSGNNLAIIGQSSPQTATTQSPISSPAPSASSGQCLIQSDFDNWYKKGTGLGKTATEYGFNFQNPTTMYTSNVHFPAESLDYKTTDNSGGVENMVNLANDPSVKSKTFTIRIYGSVGTSQADKDFANKRAEVVKKDLIAGGVPESKIMIDPAQSATDYDNNPNNVSKGMSRVVVLKFDPTCAGSTNTGR